MDIEVPVGSPAMLTDLKIANRKSVLSAFRQGFIPPPPKRDRLIVTPQLEQKF